MLQLNDEQLLVQDMARRIAQDHLAPLAAELDDGSGRDRFLGNLSRLAEAGMMGMTVPEAFGGSNVGSVAFALVIEELARCCAATAVTVSVTNMVAGLIDAVGTPEQKARYLPALCDGSWPAGGFCLTEAGAGSDPAGMRMSATRDGSDWILDGEKIYITSAAYAGLFVVWAVSDKSAPKGKGISCFLVEADREGIEIGRDERKMGQNGSATASVRFSGCRVPSDALLGRENDGFRIAVSELAGGRIGIAALARGIARAAMDLALAHVAERQQFGQQLASFQGLQWMIADRETELEAARLLIWQAAQRRDAGQPFAKEASMAKLFASEAAQRACYTALQLHGGSGYIADLPLERFVRDVRITTIYEGTSEVQRLIIAREILRDAAQRA